MVMSHPVTYFADRVHEVLDEITMVSTAGLSAHSAGKAAVQLARAEARIAALRLRLLDKADRADVGKQTASSTEAWWAQAATVDRSRARRDVKLADWLTTEFHRTEIALAAGTVAAAQAEVIVDAVRALPSGVGPEGREKAELHMIELADRFGPKELKVLGRRLLDVIDPNAADARLAAAGAGGTRRGPPVLPGAPRRRPGPHPRPVHDPHPGRGHAAHGPERVRLTTPPGRLPA